jgi:superfamily II DNA or RNA helicase
VQTGVPARGDVVWIRQQRWRVERAHREKNVVRLDVSGRSGRLTFLAPFDVLQPVSSSDRPRRVRWQSLIARIAGLIGKHEIHSRSLPAAANAAIQILPYQLEPALALLGSTRRALLADAVGLGKTIQAGVVIADLRRSCRSLRVLVAVPSALRAQWREELHQHFGIDTRCADAGALDDLARGQSGTALPWDRAGVWVGSIDYLKQPHVLRGAVRHVWDLLVIDEAHGACGQTERHAAFNALGRCSRRILLLSATPHSGDQAQFQRLLSIGALDDFHDDIVIFRRTRADLGMMADRRTRRRVVQLSIEETRVLDALAAFERAVVARGHHGAGLLLVSVFRKRALSTMGACHRSLERRLSFLDDGEDAWRQPRLLFDDADDDVSGDERAALSADIGLEPSVERSWLRRLQSLAADASRRESKVRRVLTLARRCREPLAIFTEFRDSLSILLQAIAPVRSAAVLHGGLSPDEQQRQLDRFLSGAASVLLATDVASQGLNLQRRCRYVLSLELPWNPSRLEQRAGRVDRIGQQRRVHVGLFVARHDAEDDLLDRLAARELAAQRAADSCTRWAKPARAVARRLRWQRSIASYWRGSINARRPIAGTRARSRHIKHVEEDALLLFSVPMFDGGGDLVEQRLVGVRVPAGAETRSGVIAIARDLARARLAPRVRRLGRLGEWNGARNARLERAIAQAMLAACAHGEVQPGLFDRRAVDASSTASAESAAILQTLRDRLAVFASEGQVRAGVPVLAAIVCGPAIRRDNAR